MLYNTTRETVLAARIKVADRMFSRLRGLLGEKGLAAGEALVLRPCCSVHTVGMRFPIDVLFLDRQGRVVGVREKLQPWRFSGNCPEAWETVELPSGRLADTGTKLGDEVQYL